MTNPSSSDAPKPGDVVVLTSGDHAGQEIEVKRTNGSSVVYVPRRNGTGANLGKTKAGTYKEIRMSREEFATRTGPRQTGGGTRPGTAYRREAPEPVKRVEDAREYQPHMGIIDTHGADVNLSIEWVTALQAESWLGHNDRNRKLVETRVAGYAAIQKRGEWLLVNDALMFDKQGNLRNGQHRLTAQVRSGVTCQYIVMRGVDDGAFDAMDQGKPRGIADVLHLHGYVSSLGLAGAIRLLMILEATGRLSIHGRTRAELVTAVTSLEYAEDHPELQTAFKMAESVRSAGLGGGISLWAAMFTLFYRISPEATEDFRTMLALGTGPDWGEGHPALTLRNRAIRDGSQFTKSEQDKETLGVFIIKAWNAYRKHKKLKVLTYHPGGGESFPVPI